jgi:hypothetical protein
MEQIDAGSIVITFLGEAGTLHPYPNVGISTIPKRQAVVLNKGGNF